MFFDPIFPVGFIFPNFDDFIMGTVIACSGRGVRQIVNVLVEKPPLGVQFVFLFFLFDFFLLFFKGLLDTVGADSRNLSFLLVDLNLLQVGMFDEIFIDFSELGDFLFIFETPFIVITVVD